MATLTITKSLQNSPILITEEATELSFDFNLADALFERVEEDMVVSLDDGTSIVLEDFYAIYSSEFLPNFQFLDSEVTGEEFFAALDPNLMPAAGPATAIAADGGRFYIGANSAIADGVDSLSNDGLGGGSEYTRNAIGGGPRAVNVDPVVTNFATLVATENGHDNNLNPLIFDANEEFTSPSIITGVIEAEDANGDDLTMSLVSDGIGTYGVFTFDETTNTYTYTLDNAAADSLGVTDTMTETYTILIEDGQGGSVTQEITVTIQGRNDRPELSVTANQSTIENGESVITFSIVEDAGTVDTNPDTPLTSAEASTFVVGGQANVSDVDLGAVLNFSVSDGSADQNAAAPSATTFTNAYGTFAINNDSTSADYGQFTFTLDNTNSAVQEMGVGESQVLTFTVYAYDENGAWQAQEVQVTVFGNNDKPTIEILETEGFLKEAGVGGEGLDPNATNDGDITASGTIAMNDIDVNDVLSLQHNGSDLADGTYYVVANATGGYDLVTQPGNTNHIGVFTLNGLSYTFELNNNSVTVNELNAGEVLDVNITLTVNDGTTTTDADVSLNIEGTNDKPVLTLKEAELTVIENGATNNSESVTGTAEVYDADATGTEGETKSFNLTFTPPTAEDVIAELGLTDLLNNIDFDAILTKITSLVGSATIEKVEALVEEALAQLPDLSDEGTAVNGLYGKMVVDADGEYTYTLYSQAEAEALGGAFEVAYWALKYRDDNDEAFTENFTVTVTDSEGATDTKNLTVKVFGSNDRPVIEIAQDMTVQESGNGIYIGNELFENLPDLGVPTAVGQLIAVDDINDMLGNLTFSVNSNDATLTEVSSNSSIFDKAYDVDGYGTLYLNTKTGTYTFILDNDSDITEGLNEGDEKSIKFDFTVNDGDLTSEIKEVTLTIEGTNDKPILKLDADTHEVFEFKGDAPTENNGIVKGQASFEDVDSNDTATFSLQLALPELSDLKNLSAALDNVLNIDALIKIGDITEEAYQLLANHPDNTSTEIKGLYGSLTIDPKTGEYEYTLYTWEEAKTNPVTALAYIALQKRDDGDDTLPTENFTVYVKDSQGAWDSKQITFEVKGTNDGPTITNADAHKITVQENGVVESELDIVDSVMSGIETAIDSDFLFGLVGGIIESAISSSLSGANSSTGGLVNPNTPFDGESKVDGKIEATDDDGAVIFTPSFNGAEAKPGISIPSLTELVELGVIDAVDLLNQDLLDLIGDTINTVENITGMLDGSFTVDDLKTLINELPEIENITGTLSDVINVDALFEAIKSTITFTTEGEYGSFEVDMAGNYNYTINEAVANKLAEGESKEETYEVEVRDIFGNVTVQSVVVTIKGTNDVPELSFDNKNTAEVESGNLSIDEDTASVTGKAFGSDVDNGAKLTFHVGAVAEIASSTTFNDLITSLQTYSDSLSGWGSISKKVAITTLINTLKNNPDSDITKAVKEAVEECEAFAPSESNSVIGTYGTITIDPTTGEYTYELSAGSQIEFQKFAEYDPSNPDTYREETFTIYVKDEHGAWDSKEITVTIKGVNDAPEITVTPDSARNNMLVESGAKDIWNVADDNANAEFEGAAVAKGTISLSDVEGDSSDLVLGEGIYFVVLDGSEYVLVEALGTDQESFGTLKLTKNTDGSYDYRFELNNENSTINALKVYDADDTSSFLDLDIKIEAKDEHGTVGSTEIEIEVRGTNDRPTISFVGGTNETGGKTFNLDAGVASWKMRAFDVDGDTIEVLATTGNITNFVKGEVPSSAASTVEGAYGSLTITVGDDGKYNFNYELDHDKMPAAGKNTPLSPEQFTVYVQDVHGAWVAKNITINVKSYNDLLEGTKNGDELKGGVGNDELYGYEGNDTLKGGTGDDVIYGGKGKDELYGGTGNDEITGGKGNDTIYGNEGDDFIYGGKGEDVLKGNDGNDFIYGGNNNDQLHGGFGNDTLDGGKGADFIFGDDGDDILLGGKGGDTLRGGKGNDTLTGGAGADTFVWKAEDFQAGDEDIITDFNLAEGDMLDLREFVGHTVRMDKNSDGNALITIADGEEYQTILLQLQDTTFDELENAFDTSTLIIK